MVDLGQLLATTEDLHEDTILNMTHLFQRKNFLKQSHDL
jgi:hypothetical protein